MSGKHVHMGRVNTARRMMLAKSWDVNSVDGTSVSRFRRTHLPTRLAQARAPQQLSLLSDSRRPGVEATDPETSGALN